MQDATRPATVDNLVLLTHAEADEHDELDSLEQLKQQVRKKEGVCPWAWVEGASQGVALRLTLRVPA